LLGGDSGSGQTAWRWRVWGMSFIAGDTGFVVRNNRVVAVVWCAVDNHKKLAFIPYMSDKTTIAYARESDCFDSRLDAYNEANARLKNYIRYLKKKLQVAEKQQRQLNEQN